MEEKLYFKPASYGKGVKQKEKLAEKEGKDHRVRNFIIFLAIIIIAILIMLWLLHGKTTTTGQYPANVRNEYLTCESRDIAYDKVSSIDSGDKEMKINMVFYGEETFNSASLQYTLKFNDKTEAFSAEAISHAQFNKGLAAVGLESEAFNNKFSLMDETLSIVIHTSASDINEVTASYFLIFVDNDNKAPSTISEYKSNYESQGFSCNSSK